MVFPFVHVCDLLEDLLGLRMRDKPLSEKDIEQKSRDKTTKWFENHRQAIKEADGIAFLSALLPECRTDKVYGMQETKLENIIRLSAGLHKTNGRIQDLKRWRVHGCGDLGDCCERVLRVTDAQVDGRIASKGGPITVEEIEEATMIVASGNRFSSPSVERLYENYSSNQRKEKLCSVLRLLKGREVKWFTRLILKRYLPVKIPENTVYWSYHPRMRDFLKVRASFPDAVKLLKQFEASGGSDILQFLRPQIGEKVGRPVFHQGRSVHHCLEMGKGRKMIVERKYDGEYLQLHIDLSKPRHQWIQIFSKSGKDSTSDRKNVLGTIERCLNLGKANCKIYEKCILEGELLVYSDEAGKILPFDKIRKHVNRSGSYIGTGQDSQAHSHEHLCIMFFDIMLLDEIPLLNMKHSKRQPYLEEILQVIPGRADIVQRTTVDFSSPNAKKELRDIFAKCITRHEEGLVVKPDEPYITPSGGIYKSCCIKMKKDVMGCLGDVGDFAVVGANYIAKDAQAFINMCPPVKWTEFYLGCLENREDIRRFEDRPRFKVVKTVSLNRAKMEELMRLASLGVAVPFDDAEDFELIIPKGIANGQPPETVFTKPFVFDIRSVGFEREGNTGFDSVRHPQVTKIHTDRTFMNCLTFVELQDLVEKARSIPLDSDEIREELRWRKRLAELDPMHSRDTLDFLAEYEELMESSTQGTTQESTQNTSTSNSSDNADEPQADADHGNTAVVSALMVTGDSESTQGTSTANSSDNADESQANADRGDIAMVSASMVKGDSESTQGTSTSNSLDNADESQAYADHGDIAMVSASAITADSESIIETTPAPHLGSLQTRLGAEGNSQASKMPRSEESVIPSVQSREETRPRIETIRHSRKYRIGGKKKGPPGPPAVFLEQHELARAAEEQVNEDSFYDSDDQMEILEDNDDSARAEVQLANELDSVTALTRKRSHEKVEPSSELSIKRRKQDSTSSNSARPNSVPQSSSPRKALSIITNGSSPKRNSRRQQSSASNLPKVTMKPDDIAPYPTPPDEETDANTFPKIFGHAGPVSKPTRSNHAGRVSPAGLVTPSRSARSVTSNHGSSSRNPTALNTPGSSPPSVHSLQTPAMEAPAELVLPSLAWPTCLSPSSAKTSCIFARYTFFLSPCISNMPYITENLLPPHKRPFTNSLTQWADPSFFPTHFPSDHPTLPGKRILKCVLVESHRERATANVILEIKDWMKQNNFRRSNGEKEPIVVVDWRILEAMEELERSGEGVVGEKIWKQFSAYGGYI